MSFFLEDIHMFKMAGLLSLLLVTGCATNLTEAGRNIKVIREGAPELVANCAQLALVTGQSPSPLSGGDYGVFYATIDARNKTGRIPEADTLVITDNQSRRFGGEVTGIAYSCNPRHTGPAQQAPAPAVSKDVIFEKARKCQGKGGVWVNNQCVVPIE